MFEKETSGASEAIASAQRYQEQIVALNGQVGPLRTQVATADQHLLQYADEERLIAEKIALTHDPAQQAALRSRLPVIQQSIQQAARQKAQSERELTQIEHDKTQLAANLERNKVLTQTFYTQLSAIQIRGAAFGATKADADLGLAASQALARVKWPAWIQR